MSQKHPPPQPSHDPLDSVQLGLPDWAIPSGQLAPPPGAATATFNPHGKGELPEPALPVLTPNQDQRIIDRGVIAKGGFGAIHKIFDRNLLRTVAMKTLEIGKGNVQTATLRFIEEAQITGQLDHPNIVPVHDLGINAESKHFFTMKLVKGETLTAILKRMKDDQGFLEHLNQVVEILLRCCDALAFAHARGVVHRDLKPDNIMVGLFGQVYVMDWGIAQLMVGKRNSAAPQDPVQLARQAGTMDAQGTVIGTFSYMAPEQAHGHNDKIDQRTDVFALGAILYQTLTGVPPYEGKTPLEKVMNAQAARFRPPQEVVPGRQLPQALTQIALKAMKAKPEERYQSVEGLKEDLERFRGGYWFATETFAPGTLVVKEGEEADAAYIIVSGQCEAFKLEKGKKTSLRTMDPGDVFGETAIFTGRPRTASVRAVTSLTVMVVTRESLEQQLAQQSWMGTFVRALAARFRETDQQAAVLRGRAEDTPVMNRVLEHLCFSGTTQGAVRQAPWSGMVGALCAEFGRTEAELLAVVSRSGNVQVDKGADVVVLSRVPGSEHG